jgi:hypothetical protein
MELRRRVLFCLLLALCLSTLACNGHLMKNYGRIDPNTEATQAFEKFQVNPEFRYYISGSDYYPNALMGLNRAYPLDPRTLWKEVQLTPETMKEIVEHMRSKAFEAHQFPHGFVMTDDKGRPVGVWYSILSARTFLRMEENGTVRIDTPPLDTYEQHERPHDQDSPN